MKQDKHAIAEERGASREACSIVRDLGDVLPPDIQEAIYREVALNLGLAAGLRPKLMNKYSKNERLEEKRSSSEQG